MLVTPFITLTPAHPGVLLIIYMAVSPAGLEASSRQESCLTSHYH